MMNESPTLLILGIRGIPASHGGFESFAEGFAIFMQQQGWKVTVYCQEIGHKEPYTTVWNGIQRVHISIKRDCALGTVLFDYKSIRHAIRQKGVVLTLGYNTALFSIFHRIYGQRNLMNMDGIEWRRDKWSFVQKIWLYCNEWLGARLANHLIADHPEIKKHLLRHTGEQKITVIPYAAEDIRGADTTPLQKYGLAPKSYAIVIARPEPENSILEIVQAFSDLTLDFKLVILGDYDIETNAYHRAVVESASKNVLFLGAIYQAHVVQSLRYHARVYVHGHTVGGTNPSLVESMGAGNAVLVHDNAFNRWVAGEGGLFFNDKKSLSNAFLACQDEAWLQARSILVKQQYLAKFRFEIIYSAYLKALKLLVKKDQDRG